jgi:serine/threonine-protein phosphatase 4 regulatory subunit 1
MAEVDTSRRAVSANGAADIENEANTGDSSSVRFEDLTVDDDLPIIDRVVRYTRSAIALQRLVHVKMLAETAQLAG